MTAQLLVGIDVGSTTVKAVAVDAATDAIVWSDYQRHETKQPEKTLEFLRRIEGDLQITGQNCRVFITGSGSRSAVSTTWTCVIRTCSASSVHPR